MTVKDLLVGDEEAFVYKGKLLKEPPLPTNNAQVAKVIANDKFLRGLNSSEFPLCCAVRVLHNMELYDQNMWNCYGEGGKYLGSRFDLDSIRYPDEVVLSAAVWKIKRTIDEYFRLTEKRYYLLASFNATEIKSGIRDVLVDYFGFARLENDFLNDRHGKDSRICLLGLCCTSFQPDNH